MKREFKVGDVCRIREWEDMVEEFGVIKSGDKDFIPCEFHFMDYMKYLCGATFTIKNIAGYHYYSEEEIERTRKDKYPDSVFDNWLISADMLELITYSVPETDDDIDCDFDLSALLGY